MPDDEEPSTMTLLVVANSSVVTESNVEPPLPPTACMNELVEFTPSVEKSPVVVDCSGVDGVVGGVFCCGCSGGVSRFSEVQ